MDTRAFKDLYRKVWNTRVKDFPVSSLSYLLHGFLAVYSMVRVFPWLEDSYVSRWKIHERIREIANVLSLQLGSTSISVEERVGHVADLMDSYLTYSDMDILNKALDEACEILRALENGDKTVETCRTPEMCRMLCSCYYFMNEEKYLEFAWHIIHEWEEEKFTINVEKGWRKNRAVDFYYNIVGSNRNTDENTLFLDKMIVEQEPDDLCTLALQFDILSAREYEEMNLNS